MATYKGRHCIAGTGATGAQGVHFHPERPNTLIYKFL
jgi:hypothetical protein